ncbi:MAG: hypothetical protein ABI241_00660 [Bacteroidia bacterium]
MAKEFNLETTQKLTPHQTAFISIFLNTFGFSIDKQATLLGIIGCDPDDLIDALHDVQNYIDSTIAANNLLTPKK